MFWRVYSCSVCLSEVDCIDAEGSVCLPRAPAALHSQQQFAHQTQQISHRIRGRSEAQRSKKQSSNRLDLP